MGPCFAISRKVCLVLVVLQVLVLCMLCRTLALHSDSNARSLQARSKLQVASSQCISWPESCNASRPASNESPLYRLNATRINATQAATNYVVQEPGVVTLKVMSRPGRITMAGHIMTIVRNILGEEAASGVGKIRMLSENGEEVCK